jgi:hypothetical protein
MGHLAAIRDFGAIPIDVLEPHAYGVELQPRAFFTFGLALKAPQNTLV